MTNTWFKSYLTPTPKNLIKMLFPEIWVNLLHPKMSWKFLHFHKKVSWKILCHCVLILKKPNYLKRKAPFSPSCIYNCKFKKNLPGSSNDYRATGSASFEKHCPYRPSRQNHVTSSPYGKLLGDERWEISKDTLIFMKYRYEIPC